MELLGSRNDHAQNGYGYNGEPREDHALLLTEFQAEGFLQKILRNAGGGCQQLGVCRGHGAGKDTRQNQPGHQRR